MINKLSKEIHANNKAKGFYEKEKNIGEMLALIHSEVSEALEADRTNVYAKLKESQKNVLMGWVNDSDFKEHFESSVKDTFEDELADIMIRVMDLSIFKSIDLEFHVKAKMKYNSLRSYKHGKKY